MVSVKVLQGGLKWVDENIKLGECVLENIENALAGQPICEVTFELDEEGLLKVYAIDKKTNSKKFFEISNTLNLTETQIAKMRIHANQMTDF